MKESEADSSEKIYFYFSKPNEIKVSTRECSKKEGCEFEVEALVDTNQVLYAGKNSGDTLKADPVFFDFKDKVTRKIRDEE